MLVMYRFHRESGGTSPQVVANASSGERECVYQPLIQSSSSSRKAAPKSKMAVVRLELAVRFSVSSSSVLPRSKLRVDSHADAYLHAAYETERTSFASAACACARCAKKSANDAQRFDLLRLSRDVRCKSAAER